MVIGPELTLLLGLFVLVVGLALILAKLIIIAYRSINARTQGELSRRLNGHFSRQPDYDTPRSWRELLVTHVVFYAGLGVGVFLAGRSEPILEDRAQTVFLLAPGFVIVASRVLAGRHPVSRSAATLATSFASGVLIIGTIHLAFG